MTRPAYPEVPPRRCTSSASHPDFHPCCLRIGLRIDGHERADVIWYDQDARAYRTLDTGMKGAPIMAAELEPFWKFAESRQMRRARERFDENRPQRNTP